MFRSRTSIYETEGSILVATQIILFTSSYLFYCIFRSRASVYETEGSIVVAAQTIILFASNACPTLEKNTPTILVAGL